MSNESQSLHIKLEGSGQDVVTIRNGDAEPIHVPKPITLSGDFNSPAEFVNKRKTFASANDLYLDQYHASDVHAIFNKKELSITLTAGEQERDTITVTGRLKKNPFLESLHINGNGHRHTDLLNLVRFKPHLFSDRNQHRVLVLGLQQFEVKTKTDFRDADDRKGQTDLHISQKAESKLAGQKIDLLLPLFEGYQPAPISLTIEIEPNNGSVLIYLVSETFDEFYENAVDTLFAEQRPTFEPFVIITKQ